MKDLLTKSIALCQLYTITFYDTHKQSNTNWSEHPMQSMVQTGFDRLNTSNGQLGDNGVVIDDLPPSNVDLMVTN